VLRVAGEGDGQSVADSFGYFFDKVQVFSTRSEHGNPSSAWFNGAVGFIRIDEHKATAFKVPPVITEVQQRCEVESFVGFFVDVRVPVFIVEGPGFVGSHFGEEGG